MTWNIAAMADKITSQWIIILTVNFLRATNNTPKRIPVMRNHQNWSIDLRPCWKINGIEARNTATHLFILWLSNAFMAKPL